MFGRRAAELCKEVASCKAEGLPPYNDESVRQVLTEIKLHKAFLTEACSELSQAAETTLTAESADGLEGAVLVHHQCILRNKRLLLAYHMKRLDLIKRLRWQQQQLPERVAKNLCPRELQASKEYDELLKQYMGRGEHGINLDLLTDLLPPRDPNMKVRVLEDCGQVVLGSGPTLLHRGSVLLLPRQEAEHLIREGYVADADAEDGARA